MQAEYRWRFTKRWGAVSFAGIGEVADSFSDYNTDNLLPGAGVGLWFMLSTENRLNLSFDFEVGKDRSAAYFFVADWFKLPRCGMPQWGARRDAARPNLETWEVNRKPRDSMLQYRHSGCTGGDR